MSASDPPSGRLARSLPVAWAVTALLGAGAGPCHAAPPAPVISDADLERARRHQPTITDQDIERARQQHRLPDDASFGRQAVPSTPRIDALPQPVTREPIDLGALAKGLDIQGGRPPLATDAGPRLLVFISFSMPLRTLDRLADQAGRARAALVLRGLADGSLTRTVTQVQSLLRGRKVAVLIDPQAFDRYAVRQIPTFVLVRQGAQARSCLAGSCVSTDDYLAVSGDVSLDHALTHFQRAAPARSRDAAGFLLRLGIGSGADRQK